MVTPTQDKALNIHEDEVRIVKYSRPLSNMDIVEFVIVVSEPYKRGLITWLERCN